MTYPTDETTVADLMTADLITIGGAEPIERAADILGGVSVNALPVMNGNDVVGIVTPSDLVGQTPPGEPVSSVMSRNVRVVDINAPATEAARTMRSEAVHHLIAVDGATPVGIISTFDLLRVLTGD